MLPGQQPEPPQGLRRSVTATEPTVFNRQWTSCWPSHGLLHQSRSRLSYKESLANLCRAAFRPAGPLHGLPGRRSVVRSSPISLKHPPGQPGLKSGLQVFGSSQKPCVFLRDLVGFPPGQRWKPERASSPVKATGGGTRGLAGHAWASAGVDLTLLSFLLPSVPLVGCRCWGSQAAGERACLASSEQAAVEIEGRLGHFACPRLALGGGRSSGCLLR